MPVPLRCVYVDLDGTLLGAGASFLRDGEGDFSLLGARALEACARAGVELVIYSGRRRSSLWHDARLLGVTTYAFEAGAGLVLDGELHWLAGSYAPREDATIFDQIEASGAPRLLLDRFELVHHDPWHRDREVSHLFRGTADTEAADALLAEHGHGELRLLDNGASDQPPARVYHLVPRAASKAGAVAFHMRARGYAPEECIAVGDSREDMGAAEAVGAFWLVANADEALLATAPANVRACEEGHGAGVYEAVMTELAERR
jgi:hydroxymethylpyrimidine pyrophosphatase-like HAD family hydrolase